MEEEMKYKIVLIVGLAVIIFSIFLYHQGSWYWFYPAPIGAWLFFDILFHFRGGNTTLQLVFEKKWKPLLSSYIILFTLGILIEFVGSIALNLWSYKLTAYTPTISGVINGMYVHPVSALGWFVYPFMLMQFKELYGFINSFVKNAVVSTGTAMILGIVIWEIPNVYSRDWVYSIPFVHAELFGVNVIVIIGWVLLIQMPVQIDKYLRAHYS